MSAAPKGQGCYLLHFTEKYQHAGHYLGFSPNIAARLQEHEAGHGARLTQVVRDAGIGWQLVRVWPKATRRDERRLKNRGSRRCHYLVCKGTGVLP